AGLCRRNAHAAPAQQPQQRRRYQRLAAARGGGGDDQAAPARGIAIRCRSVHRLSLERNRGERSMSAAVDPVVVSVIQHRLISIVEEMGEAMLRTSYSQILNSSRDFSTAICDLDGRLIAQAEHVPIHV